MDIEILRRRIVSGAYELTHHAKEEAAEDSLDTQDLESVILTGKISKTLTKDPRGNRYIVLGRTEDKRDVEIVCRLLPSVWKTTHCHGILQGLGYDLR